MQPRLRSDQHIYSLHEWVLVTGVHIKQYSPGVYCLADNLPANNWRWELFHLTDYVVSSVTAGTIWLVEL